MTTFDVLKLIIGVLLLVVGVVFLYSPATIIRLNALIKNFITDDKRVILYHKKIAILLISLSFIALYMGGSAFMSERRNAGKNKTNLFCQKLCAEAVKDYYEGRTRDSLNKTLRALAKHPDQEWGLVHLAVVYESLKEKDKALQIYNKVLNLYPKNKIARLKIETLSEKNSAPKYAPDNRLSGKQHDKPR